MSSVNNLLKVIATELLPVRATNHDVRMISAQYMILGFGAINLLVWLEKASLPLEPKMEREMALHRAILTARIHLHYIVAQEIPKSVLQKNILYFLQRIEDLDPVGFWDEIDVETPTFIINLRRELVRLLGIPF